MNNSYVNDFNPTVRTYYKELKKFQPLSRERERELFNLPVLTPSAKNELMTSNLKFVFDVAKRYKGKGVAMEDLISEGNLGLAKAIDKFDKTKDVKFITYAVFWIRHSIQKFIETKQKENKLEISHDEITYEIKPTISSNDTEDEIVTFNETLLPNNHDQEREELTSTQQAVINSLLRKLTPRGSFIIEHYFGLNNKKELTLDEIGEKLNLTKERVRQIKEKSIRIIRSELLLLNDFDTILI